MCVLYSQNLQKQTRNFFFGTGGGGGPGAPVLDPPLFIKNIISSTDIYCTKTYPHHAFEISAFNQYLSNSEIVLRLIRLR